MADSIASFAACVDKLSTALESLKRFESTFTPDAKKTFEASLAAVEVANKATTSASTPSSLVAQLRGPSVGGLRAAQAQLQQRLSAIVAGAVPVPRSSKEDLSNLRTELQALKIEAAPQLLLSQLRGLYRNATDGKGDVDVVEAKLDDVVRQLIAIVHSGATSLEKQDLDKELEMLHSTIAELKDSAAMGTEEEVALLSLVVNSLERQHGVRAVEDDSEEDEAAEEAGIEDEDEDDDDDPFFMPVPSALKLADASKFTELAKPIKEADSPFMIAMDDDTPSTQDTGAMTLSGTPAMEEQSPLLTDQDFVPVTPEDSNTEGAKAAAAGLAALSIPSPKGEGSKPVSPLPMPMDGAATGAGAGDDAAAAEAETGPANEDRPSRTSVRSAADSDAAAGAGAGPVAGTTSGNELPQAKPGGSQQPPDDKLNQFVNFLHGDNPGACQFHAQMRLSHEGCRKLANFIKSSNRVRALSLSHNLIGDAGLRILCEGLSNNKSVTALDLPDNDISDEGIKELMLALVHNTSLTQLQLAYNKIGNDGAAALAQLISQSQSLKKLGLSHNQIGKAGCQALTAAISSNQSLNHLQLLPGNPVEEKDAKALAKALKRNKKFSIRALLGVD